MQLEAGIYLPKSENVFMQETGEIKASFMTHKQIFNLIFVHTSQECTTNFVYTKKNTFFLLFLLPNHVAVEGQARM